MPKVKVYFGSEKGDFDITWKVLDKELGYLWYDKIKKADWGQRDTDFTSDGGLELGLKNNYFYDHYEEFMDRLDHLVWYLRGVGYPIQGELDRDDLAESLARLHEHFPLNVKHQQDMYIEERLREYNLVIHWLESWMVTQTKGDVFHFNLMYKLWEGDKELVPERCLHFDRWYDFGDLTIAYPQAGKHFHELSVVPDPNVPREQIDPFRYFSQNVCAIFSPWKKENIMKYLDQRGRICYDHFGGKEFWKYDYDDPRIGLGWLRVAAIDDKKSYEDIYYSYIEASSIKGIECFD